MLRIGPGKIYTPDARVNIRNQPFFERANSFPV